MITKKTLLSIFIALTTTIVTAQFKIGGKLAYGSEIETLGIGAKGTYEINDKITGSGELLFFFANNQDVGFTEVKTRITTLNTDVHYNLDLDTSPVSLYALGGLNFNFAKTTVELNNSAFPGFVGVGGSSEASDTFIGLNIGAGGSYPIKDNLELFSELKYVISDFDQVVFSFGVLFKLDK